MSLRIKITKGEFKGQTGKVIGVYMNGLRDVKVGRKYTTLKPSEFNYVD